MRIRRNCELAAYPRSRISNGDLQRCHARRHRQRAVPPQNSQRASAQDLSTALSSPDWTDLTVVTTM